MRLPNSNPMVRTLALTLVFEAVVFVLAIPGMITLDEVAVAPAIGLGLVAAVAAIAASGGLRRGWGWPLAWIVQGVGIAFGLLTSMMFIVGGMFALLFLVEFVLGRRIQTDLDSRH